MKRRQKRPQTRILKDRADRLCSRWIREAYDWTCAACGTVYEEGAQGLHWSHLWSRRHNATRYDPVNAAAHCFSCHQRLGGDPVEFARWIRGHLGQGRMDLLEEKKNSTFRWTEQELRALIEHIEEDTLRIQRLRDSGQRGYIEPVPYD